MILHADWTYLEQQFGCSLSDHFLMALRAFDNTRSVTPFLLERNGQRFGLFLHVEKGNVAAAHLPPDIVPVFYQPYFNFDAQERPPLVHRSLEDAILAIAEGETALTVDRTLPIAVSRKLSAHFRLTLETGNETGAVTLRPVFRDDALSRLGRSRLDAAAIARRLLARSRHRDAIAPYLEASGNDRFQRLDMLLGEIGADALIVSSIINVQEVAAVPMRGKQRPLGAIYRPDGALYVIEAGVGPDGRTFASLADALKAVAPQGSIAVEEDDLGAGLARELGLDARDTVPADGMLRRWRDHGTLPDLPFYIVTTRASRHAMEAALEFAERGVAAGDPITEMDAYAVYLQTLRAFFAEHAPGYRVARTLTNFHSGARTIFPSNAAPFALNRRSGMLKIDAGCLMLDTEGMMLGCSDIARTLCFDEAGQRYADLFARGVTEHLVPACRTGASGSEIHAAGVAAVMAEHDRLVFSPLYHDIGQPGSYERDVGHLLGRNNLAHLKFTPDETGVLREGMIACCEYQWPGDGHAIAYEDTCLVTPSGGLNLTID